MTRPRRPHDVRPAMRAACTIAALVFAGCEDEEARGRRDGRAVVAAFDEVMAAETGTRGPAVERMRRLTLVDAQAGLARDRCVVLFDALGRASALERRLGPMAERLESLADAGLEVPAPERAEVVRLYREATAATDAAGAALDPCTQAIDGLRVHRARTE